MIHYSIQIQDAAAHCFSVRLQFTTQPGERVGLSLPTWIPGSYMIREFSRNITQINACAGQSNVAISKTSKNRWELTALSDSIEIRYVVYAWDFSVRAAHLDQTHGFFNNTSLCISVDGRTDQPCQLTIDAPTEQSLGSPNFSKWKLATTLQKQTVRANGFGTYRASDYDDLIDHPVEMGCFQDISFDVLGVPHRAIFTGTTDVDLKRIAKDLTTICAKQIKFFEPKSHQAPFKEYLFMTHVSAEGYGGLEHRSSTALHCARNDLPNGDLNKTSAGYRQFLGLCSHEYFHSWNVKRIKPKVFTPYRLNEENFTSLLWIFEGFTSYYDDLLLLRAGSITQQEYLDLLAKTIDRVHSEPGRLIQSVADSSYDSWIKYYRQDENSPNALISYYTKGSLVALCLDLTIRQQTKQRYSLDDVMRLLWTEYGKRGVGLGEDEFATVVLRATGCKLNKEIVRWAYKPGELPIRALLETAGIQWAEKLEVAPDLGLKLVQRGSDLVVASAYSGRPGQLAGVSAQDIVIAIDGLKATDVTVKNWLGRQRAGTRVQLTVFRRDELINFSIKLGKPVVSSVQLTKLMQP
jgi:predicted metalloprotease with PDZ domain